MFRFIVLWCSTVGHARLFHPWFIVLASMPVDFELSSSMYMYDAFGNYIYFLSSMNIYVFFVWQECLFSVFMTITLETVHTCVSCP